MTLKLIASQSGVAPGPLAPKNAMDLQLWNADSFYMLIIKMKLQFIFEDSGTLTWGPAEKDKFMKDWEKYINAVWEGIELCKKNGKSVYLRLIFDKWTGWSISEHYEIHVTKIKKGGFKRSFVDIGAREVHLDSEDLTAVNKGAADKQRGAVHEFGHMIGLDDEYIKGSAHIHDKGSIMHGGRSVRGRHMNWLVQWVSRH